MDPHRILSRLYGSQFVRFVLLTIGMLFPLAVAASVVTGDWGLPLFFVVIMLFFLVHTILFIAFVFGPLIAAILLVWTGYKILLQNREADKKPDQNTTNNRRQSDDQP